MGICYYLVKDHTREIYDLGKHTHGFELPLSEGRCMDEDEDSPDYREFAVIGDVDLLTKLFVEYWQGEFGDDLRSSYHATYLRRVAQDVVRWAGTDLVRFTNDGSHQGWRNQDGTWDDGKITGSRHAEDHPDWPSDSGGAT
jgi:hypothetical protein